MKWIQKWIQKLAALFVVKPFFWLFFKLKVSGKEHLKGLSGPLLIIANHKFFIDSFALGAAIPVFTNIHPIRFMGEVKDFGGAGVRFLKTIGIVNLVYFIFSVFPAIRGQELDMAVKLKIPVEILKRGGVIFLHPEGKVIHEEGIAHFKRGASALALMIKAKVLPVAIKITAGSLRKNYYVKFGPVFSLPENLSCEEGADYMRNIIVDLYNTL